jgi:O-antigen ligase
MFCSVPLLLLLNAQPFWGIVFWLLTMPFISVLPRADLIYWILYRIMPPALLGLVIISRSLKRREYPPARFSPPELSMTLLILLVPGLILLFQQDPELALIRFSDRVILPFCLYLVVRLIAPRTKEFTLLIWVALFIAFSQSLIGFLSWYRPQILPEIWQYLQGERTTGSLKDPDLYAVVLIFSGVILIHTGFNSKSGWIRWGLFSVTGLCAIFAFLSLERAAWLGGIFVTIGLFLLHPKTMFRLLIIASLFAVLLGVVLLPSHFALSAERLNESDPIYDRIVIFDAMFRMFQEKPILGWGYETLDQNIGHYYHRVGEASLVRNVVTSHNTYMTVLTELGILGFLLYLFPVVWWLVLSFRVWPRLPKTGLWSRALLASFWLVMVFNFTVSNFMDMRWFSIGLSLWWLVLGLIANMVYPYLKGRDPQIGMSLNKEVNHA